MKIIGKELKNIPWEERPKGCNDPVWRYKKNPIINRHDQKDANSIFNSAVVPFKNGFAGVFRCDNKAVQMNIYAGFSKDGINWKINDEPINFLNYENHLNYSEYKYDPRCVQIGDKYYIQWCNGYYGPTIGLGFTKDFKKFYQMENITLPYNRNGVLFPEKINGNYVLLSRPSDTGHTRLGDIFLSESKDLVYWGKHRHVLSPTPFEISAWQSAKVGAGPIPIKTDKGWLMFYHGTIITCNGYRYAMGVALLDLEDPSKVIARSQSYLLTPETPYETAGDVANVVFPCATLHDSKTGRIAIYYGAADTCVALCFTNVSILSKWLEENKVK